MIYFRLGAPALLSRCPEYVTLICGLDRTAKQRRTKMNSKGIHWIYYVRVFSTLEIFPLYFSSMGHDLDGDNLGPSECVRMLPDCAPPLPYIAGEV
jgi:hypothetical protein